MGTYWSATMTKPRSITPIEEARIRECLRLDPGSPSGLTWRIDRRGASHRTGDPAGSLFTRSYGHQCWRAKLDGRTYGIHNIIWLLLHNQWPADVWPLTIDHINRDGSDNSYDNLRLATQSQQSANRGISVYGTSSYRHVSWNKRDQNWKADWRHPVSKKMVYAGYHDTEHGAHCAALASRLEHYDLLAGEWRL